MRTTLAAATVTASLLGGGALGALLFTPSLAGAQDATEESTEDGLTTRTGWVRGALDDLVADGTITGAQADAVATALADARPDHGPGHGFGRGGRGVALDTVAEVLGITEADLRSQLVDGGSLAEIATANGSTPEALVAALLAEVDAHLAEEVAEGDLTRGQADERSAAAAERLADLVERELPEGGFPGRGGPGHRFGPRGEADGDA